MTEETLPGFLANYKIVRPGPARLGPARLGPQFLKSARARPGPARIRPDPVDTSKPEPELNIAPGPDTVPTPALGRGLRPQAAELFSDAGGDGASQRVRRVEVSASIDGMRSLFDGRLDSDGTASLLAAVSARPESPSM